MITLDWSPSCVIVKCADCEFWTGFGFDRDHGWRVAAAHEKEFHTGESQAQKMASKARMKVKATRR